MLKELGKFYWIHYKKNVEATHCGCLRYFNKWRETYDILNQEATTVMRVVYNLIWSFFPTGEEILSHFFELNQTRSIPRHPQSDTIIKKQ